MKKKVDLVGATEAEKETSDTFFKTLFGGKECVYTTDEDEEEDEEEICPEDRELIELVDGLKHHDSIHEAIEADRLFLQQQWKKGIINWQTLGVFWDEKYYQTVAREEEEFMGYFPQHASVKEEGLIKAEHDQLCRTIQDMGLDQVGKKAEQIAETILEEDEVLETIDETRGDRRFEFERLKTLKKLEQREALLKDKESRLEEQFRNDDFTVDVIVYPKHSKTEKLRRAPKISRVEGQAPLARLSEFEL
ncbi:unnamed protein product [Vitrella brassicaformis CCMP3155]|uniref:Uncharacterized protein n=2 Tax=Vitrella brassicaformis TaxID=1169539 RepID=A0A0G4GYU3_VITBC|nr:unnamed protein product [Vitrella brassicaformis CCMP3155]|eukprot:CEM36370.1 unnamed protein product [Vitrella brassicaformis CCMP3155]